MLGWQLFLGAFFVKLFDFSFTAVRCSTLIVAMATGYLLQRTFVRAGIRDGNATLATLAFILSPLFVPIAFSFMSDVFRIFTIVLCLYMCLRAIQASTPRAMIAGISSAAILNGIGENDAPDSMAWCPGDGSLHALAPAAQTGCALDRGYL